MKVKHCPKCGEDKLRSEFRTIRPKQGKPFPDGYCIACRNAMAKVYYERNREQRTAASKARYYQDREDPAKLARRRAQERARARRYRERDQGRAESERQRRYRQRVLADPERAEEKRRKRREWYANGGRELLHAARARRALRRRFVAILANILRAELERREAAARAHREHVRRRNQAWLERRRAAWEAGVYDDLEPVFNGDDELVRLPAAPLAAWMAKEGLLSDEVADRALVDRRNFRRYSNGESVMVNLEIVDAVTTRLDVLMLDIYSPEKYPRLYEVPDED